MENIFDRLQFVRGLNPNSADGIFETREDAVSYVTNICLLDRPSLVAEPIFLRYKNTESDKDPYVILAIGSVGEGTPNTSNRTFFIDTQKTEEEIIELNEKIEEAIKSLSLIPLDSNTIDLSTEKTADGTIISGDVKIADYEIVGGVVNPNIIKTVDDKGIYAFVDMNYDPETFVITFTNGIATKEFQLPPDQHVVKGWYDTSKEAIVLKLADNSKVEIDVVKLIDEWTVLPDSTTPVMLIKEHVHTEPIEGVYEWQDVLKGDIRVADHIANNIIHKDPTGRYLYVKGTADNIKYKEGVTVKDALDNIDCKVSTSTGNLIYKRPDGIYAYAMLDYNTAENKLKYTYSDGNAGESKTVEFQLNSVKILEDITYDPINETIVIRYIDAQGEYQKVVIPVKDIIEEWDVNNEAHNINLVKYRSQGQGKDILSADAKIYDGDNNILEDKNHQLYVNGIASNIKYNITGETNVKNVLDNLSASTNALDEKIGQEIADRTADVERINNTIGTGFTSDPHENVTYKFEELTNNLNSEVERATSAETALDEKIEAEIERATNTEAELNEKVEAETTRATEKETELEGRIDAIDAEIGEGFGPRNTVRDEIDNLQSEIEAVSADSASSLKDIINIDESINVDKTGPTKPVISVNLSTEVEDERYNIIKLNADGLFANVDLAYEKTANKLIFHTSNGQPDKEIQLESMSSIISIVYDPNKEAIIITYMTNGHEIKTVEIPVGDLINEWRVEDGHPQAVQLEKVRVASGTSEQDVLKASVIITDDHDDNILVMDDGALYVSGSQIEQNKQDIVDIKTQVASVEGTVVSLNTAIADEIERASGRENEIERALEASANSLSDRIDEVDAKTFTLTVDDTPTVDLTLDADKKLSANVVIANGSTNIIKSSSNTTDGSGLFATVDIEYNAATNKLKLITSASEKEVALSIGSIIKSIEYDAEGKNLIIKYDVNTAGSIHEEIVFVPVEDLFNDWIVQEGQHLGAIILHKEEGVGSNPDVLSAEIVISTLQDNMIVNDQGSLYVSRAPIDSVSGALDTLRENFEESLGVEDSATLHLERDRANTLKGDVKISTDESNLIVVDRTNDGIIFNGDIDCGTY